MEYQAYILPKKRDRFFQHFLSSTAEDNYLNAYTALSGDISVTGSFFDMGMREIALPYDNISIAVNFYLVNFLRIKENGYYYYYNVTGVIKQTPKLIRYSIELDEYHTFFNNRGRDYNFKGYLKFSNTRCINDKRKIFLEPSKSLTDYNTISLADYSGNYVGVATLNFSDDIGVQVVIGEAKETIEDAYLYLSNIIREGELGAYTESGVLSTSHKFEIINGFIVPAILIERSTVKYHEKDIAKFAGPLSFTSNEFIYPCRSTGKKTTVFKIQNYRTKLVQYGTFSHRITLTPNGTDLNLNLELTVLSNGVDLCIWNGSQKLSVTDDFSAVYQVSASVSYENSNKISNSLKAITAGAGIIGGALSGNVAVLSGGILSGASLIGEEYQAIKTPNDIYGTSEAKLTYNYMASGIGIWIYNPENEDKLIEAMFIVGGDCQNLPISFDLMKSTDKRNPTAAYNYYEFTKIVSDYPQANRIAPLLLGGIEMEFIE